MNKSKYSFSNAMRGNYSRLEPVKHHVGLTVTVLFIYFVLLNIQCIQYSALFCVVTNLCSVNIFIKGVPFHHDTFFQQQIG